MKMIVEGIRVRPKTYVRDHVIDQEIVWLYSSKTGRRLSSGPLDKYRDCEVIENISTGNIMKLKINESQVRK